LAKLPVQGGGEGAEGPSLDEVAAAGREALAEGAHEEAYAIFTEILGVDPEHRGALAGMIEALVALDRKDEAQAIHASLSDEQKDDPAFERVATLLAIVAEARDPEEVVALRNAVDADPANHAARFDLANALMAAGDRDGAADALLAIIAADRDWNEGAARTQLLIVFEAAGAASDLARQGRRRLSAILFS
jgi:putative thioredoxin